MIQTYKGEGMKGIQRGLPLAVTRDGAKCFFRIGLYDPILTRIHDPNQGQPPFLKQLFVGGVCGLVASSLFNPLDIVKVRIQASGVPPHHHEIQNKKVMQVFSKIYNEQGVTGLYQGVQVNVLRSVVYTSVLLALNSRVKDQLTSLGVPDGIPKTSLGALIGSLVGVAFMNPIDVLRTRIYNQPTQGPKIYNGIIEAVRKISKHEGIKAFWKGSWAHYMRVGPHAILTFLFVAELRTLVLKNK